LLNALRRFDSISGPPLPLKIPPNPAKIGKLLLSTRYRFPVTTLWITSEWQIEKEFPRQPFKLRDAGFSPEWRMFVIARRFGV